MITEIDDGALYRCICVILLLFLLTREFSLRDGLKKQTIPRIDFGRQQNGETVPKVAVGKEGTWEKLIFLMEKSTIR